MIFTMRFYRHCDLDLISLLWSVKPRQRTKVVKRCIDAYLGIIPFQIEDIPFTIDFNDVSIMNEVYTLTIRVTENEEIFIKQLKDGFKNNALKNIVRQYIGLHGLPAYATDIDAFNYMSELNINKTISHNLDNAITSNNSQQNVNPTNITINNTPIDKNEVDDTKENITLDTNSVNNANDLNNDIFSLIGGML